MRFKVLVVSLLLIGCSNPEYQKLAADSATKAQNTQVTCNEATDCKTKWAKALLWVTNNSFYKIRIANDTIITTEGPLTSAGVAHESAISITKIPQANGTSQIIFKSWCTNQFGCVPDQNILLVRFAGFVNGV